MDTLGRVAAAIQVTAVVVSIAIAIVPWVVITLSGVSCIAWSL